MPALLFALTFLTAIKPVEARSAVDFLNSIGVNSAISRRGETLDKTIECAKYLGLRWFRAGFESDLPVANLLRLHREANVKFSYGLMSGSSDLPRLLAGGRELAKAGALLAFEGPNEPNNWGITYQGETGGRDKSWKPVAALQRDLYKAVKGDEALKRYPVWGISEVGAQVDNVGLQFLAVPKGAKTDVPEGTTYADYANVHNYVYHPNSPNVEDNKTWNAADPSSACKVDGLYGNHGLTWGRKYPGYSEEELRTLPRVTTETGCTIEGPVTEEIHGLNLLSLYLAQFKRGWSHTAVYLLRDRVDEAGNQTFGFFRSDYTPRKAAVFLHNLTSLLGDGGTGTTQGRVAYEIPNPPATVHDLLLRKSDGSYVLIVWSERVQGASDIQIRFDRPIKRVHITDPTVGNIPNRTIDNPSLIPLRLTNHPEVMHFEYSG